MPPGKEIPGTTADRTRVPAAEGNFRGAEWALPGKEALTLGPDSFCAQRGTRPRPALTRELL